jgi:eukaryotic-like serine/threonine-protein kinase
VATSRIADSVGRVLGDRYRLTRPLGMGASAHVYVAEDVTLRRRVAVKVLHPSLAGDDGFLRRFRAEAQVVASLRHPNILTVYDWGEDGDSPYLVMELLEGGSLRALLDRGVLLTPEQAAAVGADAARALDYAHRRGLVHRDIKPANLIFDEEGRVTVADFGLARALAEATWTEPSGAVVGTARYAAPEQVRGEKLDSRADVYSLALLLVEATTGAVPFASDTTLGTLMGRLDRPLDASEVVGPLRPALEAAGTVDPSARLDAAAFAHALDRVASKLPVAAPLPLDAPLVPGRVETDVASPTEHPGRPRLFDVEMVDSDGLDTPLAGRSRPTPQRSDRAAATADRIEPGPSSFDRARPARRRDSGFPGGGRPVRARSRLTLIAVVTAAILLIGGGAAVAVVATGAFAPSYAVPRLLGDTESEAAAALRPVHLHLHVGSTRYSSQAAGTVIGQSPRTGRLKQGSAVSVVVSRGPQPVNVPDDLTGLTQAAATSVLQTLGLKVGSIEHAFSTTVGTGGVIGSSPDRGTLLPGQSVSLTVSLGPPTAVVPTLGPSASASFAAEAAALAAIKLGATESYAYSDTVPKGQVIGTNPPAGTSVHVGSHVTVEISKGPDLVPVPSVQFDSVSEATQILTAHGFVVSGVTGNPTATVIGTYPPNGTPLRPNASVQIITG